MTDTQRRMHRGWNVAGQDLSVPCRPAQPCGTRHSVSRDAPLGGHSAGLTVSYTAVRLTGGTGCADPALRTRELGAVAPKMTARWSRPGQHLQQIKPAAIDKLLPDRRLIRKHHDA